jgi:hypothetical protein
VKREKEAVAPSSVVAALVATDGQTASGDAIVAPPATYYRMTRYVMVILLLGMGGWFGYDGFKGWPSENARIVELNAKLDDLKKTSKFEEYDKLNADPLHLKPLHTGSDIRLQKALAFGLPLLAGAMLAWALHNSRGEYRLAGNTLSVPGHPPIRFEDILEIDKALWDRKGIAYITYKKAGGKGRARLDDFIYDRQPTDEIYKRLEAYASGGEPPVASA